MLVHIVHRLTHDMEISSTHNMIIYNVLNKYYHFKEPQPDYHKGNYPIDTWNACRVDEQLRIQYYTKHVCACTQGCKAT